MTNCRQLNLSSSFHSFKSASSCCGWRGVAILLRVLIDQAGLFLSGPKDLLKRAPVLNSGNLTRRASGTGIMFEMKGSFYRLLQVLVCFNGILAVIGQQHPHPHIQKQHHAHHHVHGVLNTTLAGTGRGCKHTTNYDTSSIASFRMCTGQDEKDLKNGMSIINLIASRGYLPTCRVMQLMLWMASEVNDHRLPRDSFVDIGANIGSCTVLMAALGFPVVSVEPVQQHVDTIRGSIDINPSFHIELHHAGISATEKKIKANFGHGSRNWGATELHEAGQNDTFETELPLKTTDHVIGTRRVSLMKVDCEGCEWAAIKGARRALRRIPMIKIELVQPEYTAGNETVSAAQILQYLHANGFDLYKDIWAENGLYFGRRGNEVMDLDRMFGSTKFKIPSDVSVLEKSAVMVMKAPIDPASFNQKEFLKSATDVIAIEKSLSEKMKLRWLPWSN